MLLYVLYGCLHLTAHNPAAEAGRTRCVEAEVFFHADQCKRALPKGGGLTEKSRRSRSWFECEATRADSWTPPVTNDRGHLACKAEVGASDESALSALLAPLGAQARASLQRGDFKRPFQRAFRAPGPWSLFIVGTGSKVIAFVVTNLDGFQFTEIATDISSSAMMSAEDIDFEAMAEEAGIALSYPTEFSRRPMPPPGGMEAAP